MAWAKNWLVAKNDPFWQLELKMREYAAMSSQYFLHDSTSPPYPSTKNEKKPARSRHLELSTCTTT